MSFKKYKFEYSLGIFLALVGAIMRSFWSGPSLDATFYYTALESQIFFLGLSHEQAAAYLCHEIIDLSLFLTTYSLLSILVMKRLYPSKKTMLALALLPGLFDIIETGSIILFLLKSIETFPTWMGVITCAKWSSGLLSVAALIYGFIKTKRTA